MNDYKELIAELREHCLCITDGCNCGNCEGLLADKAYCRLQIELHKQAADAIEQLVGERDAAVKDIGWNCIKCKHYDEASPNYGYTEECENCGTYPWFDDEAESKWEWRGIK